jgi:hypothetical protein
MSQNKDSKHYSKLLISKKKRFTLMLFCSAALIGVAYLIAVSIVSGNSWLRVMAPISLIGLVLISLPLTETWLYEPWQNAPQRYEKNI